MNKINQIEWHNPREKIWRFDIHQELPIENLTKALGYTNQKKTTPTFKEVGKLSLKTQNKIILERVGIAIAWLMCNRQGLSIFMHPVTWQEGDYLAILYEKLIARKNHMNIKKDVIQIYELKQLRHLIVLVEGAIVLSLQHKLCNEDIMFEFRKEKGKLNRLILATETGLLKYITGKQIITLSKIVKLEKKLLSVLHERNLISSTYLNNFLTLVDEFYKKNLLLKQ